MRRRKQLTPGVECVERRLSLSAAGSATPNVPVPAFEMENKLIDNVHSSTPGPQEGHQIIAILIG